jgi:hypothetical protein
MILFVLEGARRESRILNSIRSLFFKPQDEQSELVIIHTYESNFHSLYKQLKNNDLDLIPVLKKQLKERNDPALVNYREEDFAEKYLIFDYDFHDSHNSIEKLNEELYELLTFFNEETEHGKLYINYPMVEAIRYTKKLPDPNFYTYTATRTQSHDFKRISNEFSYYGNDEFICVGEKNTEFQRNEALKNWKLLEEQNVTKANYICNRHNSLPEKKKDVSQHKVFDAQVKNYVTPNGEVSILSAFPLFLYEYFK